MPAAGKNIPDKPPVKLYKNFYKFFYIKRLTFFLKKGMISPLSVIQIIADRDAQIAQLVEQRTENPRVVGSIPTLGTVQV